MSFQVTPPSRADSGSATTTECGTSSQAPQRARTTSGAVAMEFWQARCVQGYVAVHLHSKIKLVDLAQVTHFSRCKFNRIFKGSFGCTPSEYVRRMRVARALKLMTTSEEPLCQIAAESGFADQPHFSRCFRRIVGETPAAWRTRHVPPSAHE